MSPHKCLSHVFDGSARVHENAFFEHRVRIDRKNLIAGVFYAVAAMRIGGYRRVAISPHLAYGDKGIPGVIPEHAKLGVEIHVFGEADEQAEYLSE